MEKYQYFRVNDFVEEKSFRNYVLRKNTSDYTFWVKWISENEYLSEEIQEAERVVQLLDSEAKVSLSSNAIDEEWQKLSSRIDNESSKTKIKNPFLQPIWDLPYKWMWAAAAGVAIFMTISMLLDKNNMETDGGISNKKLEANTEVATNAVSPTESEKTQTILKTPFAKTQKILLPDGSTVLLNANSVLRFAKNWSKSTNRIVWLDGEAEFSVKHYDLPNGIAQKFIVKTKEVDVEVIGTKFNLMSRFEKCKIALYEGIIQLQLTKHPEQESIEIEPNEIAQIDNGVVVRISQIKKIEVFQAWTKQHFEFDNTPLSEVSLLVENTYGIKFVFKDESLKSKRLTASIPDDDVDVLVRVIAQIFNIKSKQKSNEIIFETKN